MRKGHKVFSVPPWQYDVRKFNHEGHKVEGTETTERFVCDDVLRGSSMLKRLFQPAACPDFLGQLSHNDSYERVL